MKNVVCQMQFGLTIIQPDICFWRLRYC